MKNAIDQNYSRRTVWIHWISALLIFIIIGAGINMEHSEPTLLKINLYSIHFTSGIIVLVLTLVRIFALFRDRRPTNLYPKGWHNGLLKFVHYGFYLTIVWMCLTGLFGLIYYQIYKAVFSRNPGLLPDLTESGLHPLFMSHHIVAKIVFLLLFLHIAGTIIHIVRYRENVLRRIW
ncbi:MAG: hypothetical protein HKN33_08305 [Pyrinomonadaceae bacterium]|nr:hypothetical protein [Pyrinomonadaceae bacterium]